MDLTKATDSPAAPVPDTRSVTFNLAEASEATGISKRTLSRRFQEGKLPNTSQDQSGAYTIPIGDLLALGYRPHAPSPPDAPLDAGAPPLATGVTVHPDSEELARVRADLANWRARAEERERVIESLQEALAMAKRALPPGDPPPPVIAAEPAQTVPAQAVLGTRAPWWRRRRAAQWLE